MTDLVIDISETTDLGRSYDTLTGKTAGWALQATNVGGPVAGGGQSCDFDFSLVESTSDLCKALSLDGSLSARFALFGGSAKFGYAEEQNLHEESVFVCLTVRIQRAAVQLKPPLAYDPTALEIRKTKPPAEFRAAYGDAYVAALRTGADLAVIVEIHTSSSDERQKITSSFKARSGPVDAEGSFMSRLQEQASGREVTVRCHQRGGPPMEILDEGGGPTMAKLIEQTYKFIEAVCAPDAEANKMTVAFEAVLLPWTTAPIADGPTPTDIEQSEAVLDQLVLQQRACLDQIGYLRYALENPDRFDLSNGPSMDQLSADSAELAKLLADVRALAKKVARDVGFVPSAEDTVLMTRALPPRPKLVRLPGTVAVPDVVGLAADAALAELAKTFKATAVTAYDADPAHANQVIELRPPAGTLVAPDSPVSYFVASADEALKPPELLPRDFYGPGLIALNLAT